MSEFPYRRAPTTSPFSSSTARYALLTASIRPTAQIARSTRTRSGSHRNRRYRPSLLERSVLWPDHRRDRESHMIESRGWAHDDDLFGGREIGQSDQVSFLILIVPRLLLRESRSSAEWRRSTLGGRCHVIEATTRSGIDVRNFKRPRRPRATWSSPRRVARGAIELI
jgi:hypothetical protein